MSRAYGLLLTYAAGGIPKVFVETPDIVALSLGRKVPHVYSEDPLRLCLYWPKAREWTSDMLVDRTVVPWSYLWLFFFEDWLSTGEWRGGGVHPGDDLPAIGVL